ncbi:hypothetical protein BDB00DRAFT_264969 [Zychaea mexicana]|uniref:uncharacterized protein n=1 Tax=Zychaea mexicana TaxID=64656 RepID=UPI0022FE0D64|nr:uncharacterized protein BDB00DRAFT_264969 [Zychaea mexicana]KAI9469296.1 hypothetical protein BDB00DRAFT_264969 [Zychaea mexicana]
MSRSNSSSYHHRCQRRRRHHHRTNTAATTTDDEDYDGTRDMLTDTEDNTLIDQCAAQESQIAGDRLSKRLSGGHFGSAGGLILSTLPVSTRHQTDDEFEEEEEDNDEEENHTVAVPSSSDIMPPNNNNNNNNHVGSSYNTCSINNMSVPTAPPSESGSSQHLPNVASTVHTETSESETIVTPPDDEHLIAHRRRDSISPVDPYDKPQHRNSKNGKEEDDDDDDDDQEESNRLAAETAKRIWEEDSTVYADMEHIAEWIGNGKPLSVNILQHYFLYFDFTNMRLDDAFRKLCGKLHMKAESQQIDRILVEFANRYWDCNPSCVFGNSDVVHAVVYSLLLLNTDLHVAQGDHKKMSRSAFVRNTMNAARAQYERTIVSDDDNIPLREEHRTSNVTFHSLDSRSQSYDLKRTNSCKSSASSSSLGRFYSTAASSLDMTPAAMVHGNHPIGSKGWQSEVEAILREMYVSIRNRQIRHPSSKDDTGRDETSARHSRRRSLQITGSRVGAFKRSVGTIMWKTARESMVVSEHAELDRFYGTNATTPTSPRSTTSVHSTSFPRRRSMTSLKSSFSQSSHLTQSNSITTYQAVAPLLHHSELPTSYTSAAPYYKEGLLVRKHLLERAGQKAKHRDWKECFLVVDRGEIRMYKLESNGGGGSFSEHRKSMARSSIMISRVNLADALANNPSAAVGGGDWLANAEIIGEIDLKHTLSNALPSGYSRQRPHAFALQQPNGGVFLFQVGSADQVVEWVSTCNYWAARESKEPLMGGVSNMEYGWGSCLDCISVDEENEQETVSWQQNTFPAVTIHEWQPSVPPSVSSAMEEAAQLDILHKHVSKLNEELDKHRDVKRKMELRFSTRSTAGARAMGNWENKSQYLLHEIIKYQNYCDAIEKSLTLQAKAVEEERKKKSNNDNKTAEDSTTSVVSEEEESIAKDVAVTTKE